jgi:SAM-dependent methyltransferase
VSTCRDFDRGTPIDRYYIERFLDQHRQDIRGVVLEVRDPSYVHRFGSGVERVDVLDVDGDNGDATIVADLGVPEALPEAQYDCFVLTQTLQYIEYFRAAVGNAHRALAPGGTLLASVPSIAPIPVVDGASERWRFTAASCRSLFGGAFGSANVDVRGHGNLTAACGFLAGLAAEELSRRELDTLDERYPVVVTVRAVKAPPPVES